MILKTAPEIFWVVKRIRSNFHERICISRKGLQKCSFYKIALQTVLQLFTKYILVYKSLL